MAVLSVDIKQHGGDEEDGKDERDTPTDCTHLRNNPNAYPAVGGLSELQKKKASLRTMLIH